MAVEIKSKHSVVSKPPYQLYMAFTDMRNFTAFLPEDRKKDVTADYDSLRTVVQGFNIGVKIVGRVPYSMIEMKDDDAPFAFRITLFFDPEPSSKEKTDFHIEVSAELNLVMKMMLGSKIQQAVDRLADSLAEISEGKMPEVIDPSWYGGAK